MKFTAADIDSYFDTFAQDTATLGLVELECIFKRSFLMATVGGSEVESRAWNALLRTDDVDGLTLPPLHGDTVIVHGQSFLVAGIQTDDPIEGVTRLIFTEV